jgi:uncharacterized membrane protein
MQHCHLSKDQRAEMKERQLERLQNPALAHVIERNIETIAENRAEAHESRNLQTRLADWMTLFSGSMPFVYFHAVWFAIWIALNSGFLGFHAFDPFPFGLLTVIVSLEAIFLSTFVLVSQNRQAALADRRADLDLQINLLAEYEITRMLCLVKAIANRLDVEGCDDDELKGLVEPVEPKEVLHEIEAKENDEHKTTKRRPHTRH